MAFSRHIVGLLSVLLLINCSGKKTTHEISNGPQLELLIGTYTNNGSEGIYRAQFDTNTGELSNQELVATTTNPSYLSISKDRTLVFVVNENEEGTVSSFSWNANRTQLDRVSHQSTQGSSPCYVSLYQNGDLLATANYGTGNIAVFKVDNDGDIEPSTNVRQHTGSGPIKPNQEGPHAHCVQFSSNGRFLYAVDLGNDKILAYPILHDSLGSEQTALALNPGDGPRHLIFHPTRSLAFIVNELSSTVISATYNSKSGEFNQISRLSTLPKGYRKENACADIHLSGDGQFLYVSNRGHNSIAIFKVSHEGELERIDIESVQGNWPRNFTLSPNEHFVLVANQKSNDITVFTRDQDSGLLTFTGKKMEIDQPVCLKF